MATYTIKGTKILTSWWDLVVEPLQSNPTLQKIPVIFKILGETVLASWPGSAPTCAQCLQEHDSLHCLKRQQPSETVQSNKSYAQAAATKTAGKSIAVAEASSSATPKNPKTPPSKPPPQ